MTRETAATRDARFAALVARAEAAGHAAAAAAIPTPMVVVETDGLSDRPTPGGRSWVVNEGPCGFAWIVVRPGGSSFARWAKANDEARRPDGSTYPAWSNHYYGGLSRWVGEFGQSVTRKEAFATAYAEVLREAGINATSGSRLD